MDTNFSGSNSKTEHVIIKPHFLKRKTNLEAPGVLVENEHSSPYSRPPELETREAGAKHSVLEQALQMTDTLNQEVTIFFSFNVYLFLRERERERDRV